MDDAPPARNALVGTWKRVARGERYVIACERACQPEPSERHQTTACLGGLGWELVVIPLLLGAEPVELRHGDCQTCPLGSRVPSALRAIEQRERALREVIALGAVEIKQRAPERTGRASGGEAEGHAEAKQGERLTRRGLFSALTSRGSASVADAALSLIEGVAREEQSAPDARPWLRDMVAALLRRRRGLPAAALGKGWAVQPVIADERCSRCGICETACPSSALERPTAPSSRAHMLAHIHRCLGCDSCVRACPERAIELEPKVELRAWAAAEPVVLVTERSTLCRICGAERALPGLDRCGHCKRSRLMEAR